MRLNALDYLNYTQRISLYFPKLISPLSPEPLLSLAPLLLLLVSIPIAYNSLPNSQVIYILGTSRWLLIIIYDLVRLIRYIKGYSL